MGQIWSRNRRWRHSRHTFVCTGTCVCLLVNIATVRIYHTVSCHIPSTRKYVQNTKFCQELTSGVTSDDYIWRNARKTLQPWDRKPPRPTYRGTFMSQNKKSLLDAVRTPPPPHRYYCCILCSLNLLAYDTFTATKNDPTLIPSMLSLKPWVRFWRHYGKKTAPKTKHASARLQI